MEGAASCGGHLANPRKAARAVHEKSYGRVAMQTLTQFLLKGLPIFWLLWFLKTRRDNAGAKPVLI
jgi:hypothetical protein